MYIHHFKMLICMFYCHLNSNQNFLGLLFIYFQYFTWRIVFYLIYLISSALAIKLMVHHFDKTFIKFSHFLMYCSQIKILVTVSNFLMQIYLYHKKHQLGKYQLNPYRCGKRQLFPPAKNLNF
jgi:hypothetical protein